LPKPQEAPKRVRQLWLLRSVHKKANTFANFCRIRSYGALFGAADGDGVCQEGAGNGQEFDALT